MGDEFMERLRQAKRLMEQAKVPDDVIWFDGHRFYQNGKDITDDIGKDRLDDVASLSQHRR